jgi:hypothetical protein
MLTLKKKVTKIINLEAGTTTPFSRAIASMKEIQNCGKIPFKRNNRLELVYVFSLSWHQRHMGKVD